jgi:cold shock CspA family protein
VKGKIKKYLSYRGYGFIEVEDSEKDIFFHSSNFQSTELPGQGLEVEFRVIDTPKGKEAVDVKVVPPEAEEASEELAEPAEEEPAEEEPVPESASDLDELNGVGPKYRELLTAAGVKTIKGITEYAPEVLLANLLAVNESQGITKRPPTLDVVKEWIKTAGDHS